MVYRGNTYTYTFTHNAVRAYDNRACYSLASAAGKGTSASGIGLVSGTGTVSAIGANPSSDDAAWLERP